MKFTIELDQYQFEEIITTAAKMGASIALVDAGVNKTKITKAEAYRRYTRRIVDRLIDTGKVIPVKIQGSTLLDVKELEVGSSINDLWNKHLKPLK